MTTTHHLFTTATVYMRNERTSLSMATSLGASDDGLVDIRLTASGHRIELWHQDGREILIDLMPIYSQGSQLFEPQPPAPTNSTLELTANLIESLDMTARAHEMLGAQPPEAHAAIRNDYEEARAVLWHHITSLIRERDQMAGLLEMGSAAIHDLVDTALDIVNYLVADATELPDDMRAKLDALRAMQPATAADVAPGSEQVQ